MRGWGDEYEDPEDAEERELAAQRGRVAVGAWGESKTPEGDEEGIEHAKAMARSHTELAMMTLAHVAANGVKDAARVAAAKELLARGFGMPTRRSEQKVDVKISDQRAAHFAALQALAAQNPVLLVEDHSDAEDVEFTEVSPNSPRQQRRKQYEDETDD